ncbi:hypothetical protein ACHAXS_004739 [Conticribra weissflogii]
MAILLRLLISVAFFSVPSFSLISTQTTPEIRIAVLPDDLPDIQDCRRSAYKDKKVLLNSAISFCNADQIQREGYLCVIARERTSPYRVIGTADLNTRTKVVNNVYVREEFRKQGIGRLLMEGVEDTLEKPTTLKLTVYSSNTPAVNLYKALGFTTPGIYGGLSALSSAISFNFLLEMEKELV